MTVVDYDTLADSYDRRYEIHDYPGIRSSLNQSVSNGARVLEVGCGTGKWLAELAALGCEVAGIDPSSKMLEKASRRVRGDLRQGRAESLPWPGESFDLVTYVNSLHHIDAPELALREACRVLRTGGSLLSIGLDPHEASSAWYVYRFFPETLALDRRRFPARPQRTQWLRDAGLDEITVRIAERLQRSHSLQEALQKGLLEPTFTSQLGTLSSAEYDAGMERIRAANQANAALCLEVDLILYATAARRP